MNRTFSVVSLTLFFSNQLGAMELQNSYSNQDKIGITKQIQLTNGR
jgi:hypothetical protein